MIRNTGEDAAEGLLETEDQEECDGILPTSHDRKATFPIGWQYDWLNKIWCIPIPVTMSLIATSLDEEG